MTSIASVILEASDPAGAERFYEAAFDLGDRLQVRPADAPTSGFRGFALSLVVAQPNIVDALTDAATRRGATTLKPAKKSFWGYGGVLRAPDGAIWKIASTAKKNSGPPTPLIDDFVLLLGVADDTPRDGGRPHIGIILNVSGRLPERAAHDRAVPESALVSAAMAGSRRSFSRHRPR
jgi:hypothetical protein